MKNKKKTIIEAIDELSDLSEITSNTTAKQTSESVRETFQIFNQYLEHCYQKQRSELLSPTIAEGMRSAIQLASEAADNVRKYRPLFEGTDNDDSALVEFEKIRKVYQTKIFPKTPLFPPTPIPETGTYLLHDLAAVRHDTDYELFLIPQNDGTSQFSPSLAKHLLLVGNFDATLTPSDTEDVLKRLDITFDRDCHLSAHYVLDEAYDVVETFYRKAVQHLALPLILWVHQAIMALFLAANPKNLYHTAPGKSCRHYWHDFLLFLRKAHQHAATGTHSIEDVAVKCRHRLIRAVMFRPRARQETLSLLHELCGDALRGSLIPALHNDIEQLIQHLHTCPSGPLMKTVHVLRDEQYNQGFDPFLQGNAPGHLVTLTTEDLHTTIIHLPVPLQQQTISQAHINPEFRHYLDSLGEGLHLYVNVQDRHGDNGRTRCSALETLSLQEEIAPHFVLLSLPKEGDFYHQRNFPEPMESEPFFQECLQALTHGFSCSRAPLSHAWLQPIMQFVYEQFFHSSPLLTQAERHDFIEILYFFIVLKQLDQLKPDVLNFSCKDGVDAGACATAMFYGCARLLSSSKPWDNHDRDCLLFILLTPALFVRHRSINPDALQRTLSALAHFEATLKQERHEVLQACAEMLPKTDLDKLKILEIA